MGYATTRTLERVAAAIGVLESAPIDFESTRDVAAGGVLLAVPALLAQGLLRHRPQSYQLPKGFYGIDSIFLLLALMALTCIGSVEQLRYQSPGRVGQSVGSGPHSGSAHAAGKNRTAMSGLGTRPGMPNWPRNGLIATLGKEVIPWVGEDRAEDGDRAALSARSPRPLVHRSL